MCEKKEADDGKGKLKVVLGKWFSVLESHFNMQGSAKEFAIVVDDTDSVSSLSDFDINEDEPTRVKGSPLKVLPASKYR